MSLRCLHKVVVVLIIEQRERGHNLQDISNHSHRPHVGGEVDVLKVDHLGCGELGRAEHHLQPFLAIEASSEAKVDELDAIARACYAQHILGLRLFVLVSISTQTWFDCCCTHLHVEVDYLLRVNVFETLADLSHKNRARLLGEDKVVVDDSFE